MEIALSVPGKWAATRQRNGCHLSVFHFLDAVFGPPSWTETDETEDRWPDGFAAC